MNDAIQPVATNIACARCRFVMRDGPRDWACMRNPPMPFVFLTPPVVGNQPGQIQMSAFPRVQPNWQCGEFKPRLADIS